jgi:hypothetical protein
MDQINGHKVGWALGAILYEINELPWELHLSDVERHPLPYVLAAARIGKSTFSFSFLHLLITIVH